MSYNVPEGSADLEYAPEGGVYVPNKDGVTTWFNGDVYSVKLTGEQTGGNVGLVVATVPPGGGPPPHVHGHTDETFYVVDGELDFLDVDKTFTVAAGDVVFLPRGRVHRFYNPGLLPAKLVFVYTPGGVEGVFAEGGDEPQPGVQVQPWPPERIDERLINLLAAHDTTVPPQ
ncbi:Cupin domain-containing protein [Asanoa hainanensis]|uniref:Cupin domain-containing protein n=1 Tax=Asanoa hainanensis TaxID=560556 RepID=A0A239PCH9_9ACTN|nr:cupin domain-containing protein [Asanoa hainanensis]SNT64662.1 Cupin domain-containing protein [Asanoa hainanensis]